MDRKGRRGLHPNERGQTMTLTEKTYVGLIGLLTGLVLLVLASTSKAAEKYPTPKHLRGGQVTLKTNTGLWKGRSEDLAIVKRKNLSKYKSCKKLMERCPMPVAKTRMVRTITKTKKIIKPNTVTFHAGVGKNGVIVKDEKDSVLIEPKTVPILGMSYARHIGSGFSVGISVYTNETFTGNVGYSW